MIMKLKFAKRMSYIKASEIREILKVTEREDVISFAGGLPAPELFPIDEINKMNQVVLQEAGAKRLIPLNVSGPFHTALLESASQKLAQALEDVEFNDFACPLVGNTEAKVMGKERIAELLTRQVKEPVRFYESIAVMQEAGVTRFIEIGPGKVLSGFVKKIDKTAQLANVEDQASLQALLEN